MNALEVVLHFYYKNYIQVGCHRGAGELLLFRIKYKINSFLIGNSKDEFHLKREQ